MKTQTHKNQLRADRPTRSAAGLRRVQGVAEALALLAILAAACGTASATVLQQNSGAPYLCANVKQNAISNGTAVIAYSCSGDFNEQWSYVNGQFLGLGTTNGVNKCLDVKGALTAPGTLVDLYNCNGGANQQWLIYNGTVMGLPNSTLIVGYQSGLCLDSSGGNGAQLTIETCTGSTAQNWKVE